MFKFAYLEGSLSSPLGILFVENDTHPIYIEHNKLFRVASKLSFSAFCTILQNNSSSKDETTVPGKTRIRTKSDVSIWSHPLSTKNENLKQGSKQKKPSSIRERLDRSVEIRYAQENLFLWSTHVATVPAAAAWVRSVLAAAAVDRSLRVRCLERKRNNSLSLSLTLTLSLSHSLSRSLEFPEREVRRPSVRPLVLSCP